MSTKKDNQKTDLKIDDILKKFKQYPSIFELSPEAILLIDNKGFIIAANQRLEEWLSYSTSEVVGIHVSKMPMLSAKNKLTALAQFSKRMTGQKLEPYELEMIAKDNIKKVALIQATVIKDSDNKAIIDLVMLSDISERKYAEDKLRNNAKELEKINKLMLGREYKIAELKNAVGYSNKMNMDQSQKEIINNKVSFFSLFKQRFNAIKNDLFFQIMFGIIGGLYISLVVIIFSVLELNIALLITIFITLLVVFIIFSALSSQKKLSSVDDKNEIGILNLLQDIAEEKDYEEMRSKSILENIGEGIVITNEKGIIVYINSAFEKFAGCFDKDIKGKDFAETVRMFTLKGEILSASERSDSAAITAKNQEMKVLIECAEGVKTGFLLTAAPIRVNEKFRGVVRVVHDISEELAISQQKDDFFSIASHELRTPLTVIGGNIDIILEGYGKSKLTKDDTELLLDVRTASDRLIKMVNEFLNVSRLDQGRLTATIEELDACKITEDVVKELVSLVKKKDLKLEYVCSDDHEKVNADENLIREILINLIGNSTKFTKTGGIKVTHESKDGFLTTIVSDTGMGIAKDKHSILFERFQQAMSRTLSREAGGTGLGLYISREFARLMGGDLILAHSEEGKGSSFSFTLPLVSNSDVGSSTQS